MQSLINLQGTRFTSPVSNFSLSLKNKIVVPIIQLAFHTAIDNIEVKAEKDQTLAVDLFNVIISSSGFSKLVDAIKDGSIRQLSEEFEIPIVYWYAVEKKEYSYIVWDFSSYTETGTPLEFLKDIPTEYHHTDGHDWFTLWADSHFKSFDGAETFNVFPQYRYENAKIHFITRRSKGYLAEKEENMKLEYHLLSKVGLKLKRRVLVNQSIRLMYGSQLTSFAKDVASKQISGLEL